MVLLLFFKSQLLSFAARPLDVITSTIELQLMCLPPGLSLISQIQFEVYALIGIPLELQAPPRRSMWLEHWLGRCPSVGSIVC